MECQLPHDWEATVDECLAQSSIMQDSFRCWLDGREVPEFTAEVAEALREQGPLGRRLSCAAAVHLPLPEEGIILQVSGEKGGGEHRGPVVRHLPPLMLRASFPPGYPTEKLPYAALRAEWLTPAQATALRAALAELWEEQGPGCPVLFTWIDWLEGSALRTLGIDGALPLSEAAGGASSSSSSSRDDGQADEASAGVGRGKGGVATGGVDALMVRLLQYSAMREAELFRQGTHTCGVCLEELPGTQFVRPAPGCGHAFCGGCVRGLCGVHVAEGTLDALRCPLPDCKAPFARPGLAGVLTGAELARWEELELAQTLQRMPDVVYCPRCSAACLEDAAANMAQCGACFFAFCSLCNESWHPGVECMTPETKLRLLRARMAGAPESVAELRRKEMEYLSLVRIQETSKRCPACGMAIQKSQGCNKMTCSCGAHFCWKCQKQVDGYSHFRSGECVLFEVADIEAWQLQWNRQMMEQRANDQARNLFWRDAGGANARVAPCPQCGQHSTKMHGNNHMRCWACGSHFCGLCRQNLKGSKGASGLHFGKGKCLQHTPD